MFYSLFHSPGDAHWKLGRKMLALELFNSLVLTFSVSEVLLRGPLLATSPSWPSSVPNRRIDSSQSAGENESASAAIRRLFKSYKWVYLATFVVNVIVATVNFLGEENGVLQTFDWVVHLPWWLVQKMGLSVTGTKVLAGACGYAALLSCDVSRFAPYLTAFQIVKLVSISLCTMAPIIPMFAVLISTVLLFIISFSENILHVDPEIFDAPIFYGVIYGPFAFLYYYAKRVCLSKAPSYLP